MMKASGIGLVGALVVSLSGLSWAEENRAFHPTGLVDMYTGSMAEFNFDFAIGEAFTGYLPQLAVQYGTGSLAVGIRWGLAIGDQKKVCGPGGCVTGWFPQNIGLDLKGKHCFQDGRLCLGLNLGMGLAKTDLPHQGEDLSAYAVGIAANQLRYSRYIHNAIALEPLGTFAYQEGAIFLQLSIGPSFGISLSADENREIHPALLYEAQIGMMFFQELLAAGVGFRGQHIFADEDSNAGIEALSYRNLYSLDISLRLFLGKLSTMVFFGKLSPMVRVSVPLSEIMSDQMDVSVMIGAVYEF